MLNHVLCQAAATYCIMRKHDVGFGLYHKALQEEPESLEALHDLGGFHWDMGELDKADQLTATEADMQVLLARL